MIIEGFVIGEKMGKLIVIEGTDCSGKETQAKLLIEKLDNTVYFGFPNYDSPTGKIVGGPYLGKSYICDGWFDEGANNVEAKVASLYFAADRRYNISKITDLLNQGYNVIVDRYVYSNMAHQGGKIVDEKERFKMYDWLETLEFNLLELPHADIKVFLHMPYEESLLLKKNRKEAPDQHEQNESHLRNAEKAYIEISKKFDFKVFECVKDNKIKSIDEINNELFDYVGKKLEN